jgi:hypothetical protein
MECNTFPLVRNPKLKYLMASEMTIVTAAHCTEIWDTPDEVTIQDLIEFSSAKSKFSEFSKLSLITL